MRIAVSLGHFGTLHGGADRSSEGAAFMDSIIAAARMRFLIMVKERSRHPCRNHLSDRSFEFSKNSDTSSAYFCKIACFASSNSGLPGLSARSQTFNISRKYF